MNQDNNVPPHITDPVMHQRLKLDKPFTLHKKYKSLDEVAELGSQVQEAVKTALSDPKFGLELDYGRAFVTVELEITVDPSNMPTKSEYNFSAPIPVVSEQPATGLMEG